MAKMKLSESSFVLIPEGVTIFKIVEIDDSKYEDYGKLVVKMQTVEGLKHSEQFSLINDKGNLNEGVLKAWSCFARTAMGKYNIDELDTDDLIGRYIQATVKHEEYTRTKGDKAGQKAKSARLNDYDRATGFAASDAAEDVDDLDDLDDFLN